MTINSKLMHSAWNKTPDWIAVQETEHEMTEYNRLITSLFCPGPHYYYIVDFFDRQIKQMSGSIEPILGIKSETATFDDIINTIHPDDMAFVIKAEEMAFDYYYNVLKEPNAIINYKTSYCFRSKVADGSYQLFHHQAIVLTVDENGGCGRSINIHTSIHHITTENNYKLHLIRLDDEMDIIELEVNEAKIINSTLPIFSKREVEIINLITLGFTNNQIAERLCISHHTVRNHRKNILKKAEVKNSVELIAKCLKEGLL